MWTEAWMYMYMCVYMPRHRAALEERVYAGDLMQAEAAEFVPYSKFAQDVSAMLASCKVCSSFGVHVFSLPFVHVFC